MSKTDLKYILSLVAEEHNLGGVHADSTEPDLGDRIYDSIGDEKYHN